MGRRGARAGMRVGLGAVLAALASIPAPAPALAQTMPDPGIATPQATVSARDADAILAAIDVYRGAHAGALAVVSDRTIGRGFLPTPGTADGAAAIPEALLDALKDRNVARAPLDSLCDEVERCRVLTAEVQARFRDRAERRRQRALDGGERLPRGYNPFWAAFNDTFPKAAGLLRVSLPAFSQDGSRALVAIVWTAHRIQGGSQLVLMKETGWGWEIERVVAGNLAL
ncbi:hypothetical protein CCR85_02000 [Rhodothalassium salexigens]|uniref:hypothetical protein n=1 Tax=Rhodothalassium salexigens TaxID=1086 RepID=UPI00191253CB|nr:hypothetical protein [Rhodothalassium salexigens]MBK5910265.1 hypothetical protein [Rhodothalassium salexigens]MBK5921374.1 hypothetical protein [Rhodothalassium salexigens]